MSAVTKHNAFLEEGVIGMLLRFPERFYDCGVSEDHFYVEGHKNVIRSYLAKGPSLQSASGSMGAEGDEKLMELAESCWSDAGLEDHIEALSKLSAIRKVAGAARSLLERLETLDPSEALEESLKAAGAISGAFAGASAQYTEGEDCEDELLRFQEGFTEYNVGIEGFAARKQELIGIAGRPGWGKSTLLHHVAMSMVEKYDGAFPIFAMEMSRGEWFLKCIQRLAGRFVPPRFQSGDLNREYAGWAKSCKKWFDGALGKMVVYDDYGLTVDTIRARCLQIKARHSKLLAVGIDQLSLMNHLQKGSEGSAEVIKRTTGRLKGLAKELDCPIFVLSQLTRKRDGEDYRIEDIFGSDGLAQDANQIWIIQPGDGEIVSDDVQNIILKRPKWRLGSVGEQALDFLKKAAMFRTSF